MAESRREDKLSRALNMINEAVSILQNPSSTSKDMGETSSDKVVSSNVVTVNNSRSVTVGSTLPNSQKLSEITKLFPYYQTSRQNAGPSRVKYAPYVRFKPKESWTHLFVCLSDKDGGTVPSREQKLKLKEAGLGERKIVFADKKGSFAHVKSTLENVFPKLKELDGGFEILRANTDRRFLGVIPIPPMGYTVPELKSDLGHAIAYVRPVQKNLDMEPVAEINVDTVDLSKAPTIKCVTCGENVAVSMMRCHKDQCGGGSSSMELQEDIEEKVP